MQVDSGNYLRALLQDRVEVLQHEEDLGEGEEDELGASENNNADSYFLIARIPQLIAKSRSG
jgi:hypothetical protein